MGIYFKNYRSLFFFLLIYSIGFSNIATANSDAENFFQSGFKLFKKAKYENAIENLANAIKLNPKVAKYHHILAKSYGREAEQSGWLKAIRFAKKTQHHLELAAKLDAENVEILNDLMNYYLKAPIFLGGDSKKASKINSKIEKLRLKEN